MPPRQPTKGQNRGGKTTNKNFDWIASVLTYEGNQDELPPEKRQGIQEDLLRLLRKLREGVMASGREDSFATDVTVYEMSLFLAAAYGKTDQVTAVATHLLPTETIHSAASPTWKRPPPREFVILLILLHHIVIGLRSSASLRWVVLAISSPLLTSKVCRNNLDWLKNIILSLRAHNYQSFWKIASEDHIATVARASSPSGTPSQRELAAIHGELHKIRQEESEKWLSNTLRLGPLASTWLSERQRLCEASPTDGKTSRWTIYKPKA
ncbi:SubName: Full=Uncharacterized protein {ECO:0000313/EMBL:CCA70647.1} [Serendipita indica DSM 11827]|nr:SubName: Full=Uncharacterized protein {ECO:0000313/EMBL:CCA70647.1} [Serendipita indica DSM 11827]